MKALLSICCKVLSEKQTKNSTYKKYFFFFLKVLYRSRTNTCVQADAWDFKIMFQRAAWHMQNQIFTRAVQPKGCPNGAQQCLFSTSQDRENPATKPHKMLKLMSSGQCGTTSPNGKVLTPISPSRAKWTVSGKSLSLKNANYRNSLLISRNRV